MKKRHADKKNILLVNITRLGDMLQATPTIAGIKLENPNAKVTVLVEKQFEEVCHYLPNIDEVLSLDLGMTCRSLAREQDGIIDAFEYVGEVVEDLRSKKFDYCLNMSSSAYTAMLLRLLGVERNGGWTADEEGCRIIESDWARLFATSVFHQNRQYNSLNLVDVFRCSADVEAHPKQLQITINQAAREHAEGLIREAAFTNTGPIITIQAGASQEKRQWAPRHFSDLINILTNKHNARVVLVGTKKELPLITSIVNNVQNKNVFVAAGKTSIPQLAALLATSSVLITGDTGTMHVSVAAGTPVVAMFLASAFGFETGPYSADNLILQPIIGCGPCNPNKPCARPDCHETIEPNVVAELAVLRSKGPVMSLPPGLVDSRKVIAYRSTFDDKGFYDMVALNPEAPDPLRRYRNAYRKMWLDDLAGFPAIIRGETAPPASRLAIAPEQVDGLNIVQDLSTEGARLINCLASLIRNPSAPAQELGAVNRALTDLDRRIEQIGFHFGHLGPVTRMFVFAKENMVGTEALDLASQMGSIYSDLSRRCTKLGAYYAAG